MKQWPDKLRFAIVTEKELKILQMLTSVECVVLSTRLYTLVQLFSANWVISCFSERFEILPISAAFR